MQRPALALFATFLSACAAPPNHGDVYQLHERILRLHLDDDGDLWVAFEVSARSFVILHDDPSMQAAAKRALVSGEPVYATVPRAHGPKSPEAARESITDKRTVAIVWLAETPDPDCAVPAR